MQRILILGAGGHGRVVADCLLRAQERGAPVEPLGFLDDSPGLRGSRLLSLAVLGRLSDRTAIAHDALVIAIGDNRLRARLFQQLQLEGEQFALVQHPAAIIAPDVAIGAGSMLMAGAVVNPGAIIGQNVIVNTCCSIDHDGRIGDHAHIAPGARLGGQVTIEAGALVGMGATVLPRCRIGAWSTVGAGALVLKDIPEQVVALGAPARVRG